MVTQFKLIPILVQGCSFSTHIETFSTQFEVEYAKASSIQLKHLEPAQKAILYNRALDKAIKRIYTQVSGNQEIPQELFDYIRAQFQAKAPEQK